MKSRFLIIILFFYSSFSFAQFNGRDFSIALNGVYTTTAKIYLSPNSSDAILRNNSFPLEDIFSPAIDFRYALTNEIVLGFNTEYMTTVSTGDNVTVFSGNITQRVAVEDGFKLIPLELSVYYNLPFSTESFKFMMGAGGGYYIGEHVRNIGNAKAVNKSRKTAYGIHVSVSMDYLVKEFISIRTEMKFRDPQFTVTSEYDKREINLNGRVVRPAAESFDSKINIDGVTFIAGIVFHF